MNTLILNLIWPAVPDVQASRENAEGLLRGDTTPFNIDGAP
jgi:hypothetical protein